jgi:dsRNA-specific ribonuclease
LSTKAFSAGKKREDSMEAASGNDPCVQKVLQVIMHYAGAFVAFVAGKSADLGEKVGRIFSHKSLEELDGKPSNKTSTWTGDKLFGWEVTKILHGTSLNSMGKLTNHHSYYTCAQFQERTCKYLGLDALLVAAQQHEALYPDRSAHSKSSVVETLVCFIFETIDKVPASTFVRNVLIEFAKHDEYYPHDVRTEFPQKKLDNS